MTKGARIPYSAKELLWIKSHAKLPRREAHARFSKKFQRNDVSLDNYKALCTRKGWSTGRTGRFDKGSVPANKGKTREFNANSARTQFKKGAKPANLKPLGHERVTVDGYVEIKVAEKNPHTGAPTRYVAKHRHLWERENGPLPEGHALKCLDGDKTNCATSNWKAIPRAMLPRLNGKFGRGYDTAPEDLKPLIMATAELENLVREAKRPNDQEPGCSETDTA